MPVRLIDLKYSRDSRRFDWYEEGLAWSDEYAGDHVPTCYIKFGGYDTECPGCTEEACEARYDAYVNAPFRHAVQQLLTSRQLRPGKARHAAV